MSYQIINNWIYLKQSNNFKRFEITTQTLRQMSNPKYSFYTYCFSDTLELNDDNETDIKEYEQN